MRARLAASLGLALAPRRLPTIWRKGGDGALVSGDFDAASEDGAVVAQISTSVWLEPGQRRKIVADAARMAAVPGATRRMLVFATKMAADDASGVGLPAGTEVVLVPLSVEEMRLLVEVTEVARKEMGVGGAMAPLANARDRRQRRFDEGLAWMRSAARGAGED
jgi:hypothetical protein